jgi:hypothetical protein
MIYTTTYKLQVVKKRWHNSDEV